jgi:hypothetical protein
MLDGAQVRIVSLGLLCRIFCAARIMRETSIEIPLAANFVSGTHPVPNVAPRTTGEF